MANTSSNILSLIQLATNASKPLTEGHDLTETQRQQIIVAAEKLAISARQPEENVYYAATQIAQTAAIRSLISMDVFNAVPRDGSAIDATVLSGKLNVDKALLVRILRACTSAHLFDEVGVQQYAHNNFSKAFLEPNNRSMMAQVYDFTSKGVFALPEYGAKTGWKNHGTYTDGPFQLGARTKLGFWEYLQEIPERMALFSAGMRSQTTIGHGRRSGAYPFGPELAKKPCEKHEVLIVDVGGGRGQSLEAIKHDYPELKGRFILQDLGHVVQDATESGLPSYIEPHVGSFFETQTIRGARIYYFRRIFHDWDQIKSREILLNTRQAMNEDSSIVIADMALPDIHAPRDMALQDINMMSFGGMERTETQWAELIESAGLEIRKIWRSESGAKHAVVEAVLPRTGATHNGSL